MSSSSTITEAVASGRGLDRRAAPGEVLADLWLDELGMSADDLAVKIGEDSATIQRLLDAEAPLTPALALKIARLFDMDAKFWMNLQTGFDLYNQARELEGELDAIEPVIIRDAA